MKVRRQHRLARAGHLETDPADAVQAFRARRNEVLALLRALPPAVWRSRTGIHAKAGEITIEQTAQRLADHDDRHLAAIAALPA